MENNCYVYGHYRLDDGQLFYIGKGANRRAHSKEKRNQYWTNIVNKHGYKVVILHENLNESTAFEYEKELIRFYGRKDIGTGILANQTDGGEGTSGCIHSPETKAKMGVAKKGNKYCLGKLHSSETKAKLRAAKKGNKNAVGTIRSSETRAKDSLRQLGKTPSPETRAKLSAANSGKTLSPETRTKISKAQMGIRNHSYGKPLSPEHKAKISAAKRSIN